MRKFKPNLPLVMGLILFSVIQLLDHSVVVIPDILHYVLLLSTLSLELLGVFLAARSPELKNSKLRQWKLRLIGKEPK